MFARLARLAAVAAGVLAASDARASLMPPELVALPSYLPPNQTSAVFPGNDKPADLLDRLNAGLFPSAPTGWTLVGSSDDAAGPFAFNPEANYGDLELNAPVDGPFVLALKAGPNYKAYFFDGSFGGVTGFLFSTHGLLTPGGEIPDLSHATLYRVSGGNFDGNQVGEATPEPATLAVWGAVAGGLAVLRRRRRRAGAD